MTLRTPNHHPIIQTFLQDVKHWFNYTRSDIIWAKLNRLYPSGYSGPEVPSKPFNTYNHGCALPRSFGPYNHSRKSRPILPTSAYFTRYGPNRQVNYNHGCLGQHEKLSLVNKNNTWSSLLYMSWWSYIRKRGLSSYLHSNLQINLLDNHSEMWYRLEKHAWLNYSTINNTWPALSTIQKPWQWL